jgi:hypothetical protein
MVGQFKYKDIKQIIDFTNRKKYHDKCIEDFKNCKVGYYHPSNANWVYHVYVIQTEEGYLTQVVSVFGHIVAKYEPEDE